jgi:hypothetical protein
MIQLLRVGDVAKMLKVSHQRYMNLPAVENYIISGLVNQVRDIQRGRLKNL